MILRLESTKAIGIMVGKWKYPLVAISGIKLEISATLSRNQSYSCIIDNLLFFESNVEIFSLATLSLVRMKVS